MKQNKNINKILLRTLNRIRGTYTIGKWGNEYIQYTNLNISLWTYKPPYPLGSI